MARKHQTGPAGSSGYTILVVDDSPEILESTRRLMEKEGHRVVTAPDGPSGLALCEAERVQLILVDYFMPGMTGEEFVRRLRQRDGLVQIILVTGYSGEKPARLMMRELDIQGYHDKSEGAEKLLLWVDTALKAYRHVLAMEKHRTGLRFILDVTPELHRMQPLDDLLEGLLWQIEGLIGAENSFLATVAPDVPEFAAGEGGDGFVALLDAATSPDALEIRYGTGRFTPREGGNPLPATERAIVDAAIQNGAVTIEDGASAIPLLLGTRALGVIFLDRHTGYERDRELLEVFAFQAAAAIQNALLYDMATTDSLTGTYLRGFAIQQLMHSIKRSARRGDPLSLLMIDLDKFKEVNDRWGHQAGDRALMAASDLLRETLRETDVVGRYGGDEFMVVLPDTPAAGALIVANRLLERASRLGIELDGETIPIRLSVGVGALQLTPEEADRLINGGEIKAAADGLIACADRALYAAKGTGRAGEQPPVTWTRLMEVGAE